MKKCKYCKRYFNPDESSLKTYCSRDCSKKEYKKRQRLFSKNKQKEIREKRSDYLKTFKKSNNKVLKNFKDYEYVTDFEDVKQTDYYRQIFTDKNYNTLFREVKETTLTDREFERYFYLGRVEVVRSKYDELF